MNVSRNAWGKYILGPFTLLKSWVGTIAIGKDENGRDTLCYIENSGSITAMVY